MTDGVIKGTGNSRYLKTVPNALTLYPDWPTALQAMVDGTFPVDFNGINPNGWTTQGTKLNKANLLTDAVANALALTGEKTPTQAFEKLRQLVNTAQSKADMGFSWEKVEWIGTDPTPDTTSSGTKTVYLSAVTPILVVVYSLFYVNSINNPKFNLPAISILCKNLPAGVYIRMGNNSCPSQGNASVATGGVVNAQWNDDSITVGPTVFMNNKPNSTQDYKYVLFAFGPPK